MVTVKRIKVVTGHAAHARFNSEIADEPIGSIPRRSEIPSPYSFGPTHLVWDWKGTPIFTVETRHRRYEVFSVSGPLNPVDA